MKPPRTPRMPGTIGGALALAGSFLLLSIFIPETTIAGSWPDNIFTSTLLAMTPQRNVYRVEMDSTNRDSTATRIEIRRDMENLRHQLERTRALMQRQHSDSASLEELNKALEELNTELEQRDFTIPNLEQLHTEMGKLDAIRVNVRFDHGPFLGMVVHDMDYKLAYEMHYDYNYGVIIRNVFDGSAAAKAGLRKNDIVMELDGEPVRYKEMFENIVQSKSPQEELTLRVFRNERTFTTKLQLLEEKPEAPAPPDTTTQLSTAEAPEEEWETVNWDEVKPKKERPGTGFFGGSWLPYYYMGSFDDINAIITSHGFTPLREDGQLFNGGAFKFNIGNNWYLGMAGAGYSLDHKTGLTLTDGTKVTRRMNFKSGFLGGTLDKRYALSNTFVVGSGFLLGGGGTKLKVAQTSGDYSWPNLNSQLLDSYNTYYEVHKNYLLFQPRVSLLIRLKSWLGIRAEAGYLLSYSFNRGWTAKLDEENYEIKSSPSSSYNGWTISVGPWFGF